MDRNVFEDATRPAAIALQRAFHDAMKTAKPSWLGCSVFELLADPP